MPKRARRKSVFLNIPYDDEFEDLYLGYIVGLTQLGLTVNAALAIPHETRLDAIIQLIEASDLSIHDLSRVELSGGVPRFNMPLELGLALYHSRKTRGKHLVSIFDRKPNQAKRSTSDVNGVDLHIHHGSPKHLMIALRNIFRQPGDITTVPEMLASYRAVKRKLPVLRKLAGGGTLFAAAIFRDILLAALVEAEARKARRTG